MPDDLRPSTPFDDAAIDAVSIETVRVTSTDGVELAVHHLGGDGDPLLLCHATGFHGRAYLPLAATLAERYSCWAIDFRGHGDSLPPDDGRFDWHGFGDDVLAVVDHLELAHPLGFGHSKGGAALLLAEQERPGTFRALWCFEPIVFPTVDDPAPRPDNPLAAGAERRREVFPSRQAAYDNYASKQPLQVLTPQALWSYVQFGFSDLDDGTVRLKARGADEAQVYRMGSAHSAYGRLGEVRCPVTVASGAHTDAIGPEVAAVLADRLPGGRRQVFDDLGHFGPFEDPAAVAAAVLEAFAGA